MKCHASASCQPRAPRRSTVAGSTPRVRHARQSHFRSRELAPVVEVQALVFPGRESAAGSAGPSGIAGSRRTRRTNVPTNGIDPTDAHQQPASVPSRRATPARASTEAGPRSRLWPRRGTRPRNELEREPPRNRLTRWGMQFVRRPARALGPRRAQLILPLPRRLRSVSTNPRPGASRSR